MTTLSKEESAIVGMDDEGAMTREEAEHWRYQLKLLDDTGLVEFRRSSGGVWFVNCMSWQGHDFLESVRDPEIWKTTKDVAKKAGGSTFDTLIAIAKGLIKTKIEKHTGINIDL